MLFGLFKKKSKKEKLQQKYDQLMRQAHQLSKTNRRVSDEKYAEADIVFREIEALEERD